MTTLINLLRYRVFLVAAVVASLSTAAVGGQDTPRPIRVMFVGNSQF